MPTLQRTSTTEMEVTSIRLERDLKERLKVLAGNQGYQALIREVLWRYVEQQEQQHHRVSQDEIVASVEAIAHQPLICAMTGVEIQEQEPIFLGWTVNGDLVPLSAEALEEDG
jgi:predicted DNA-binding protein